MQSEMQSVKVEANKVEHGKAGGWGGTCTCPDGTVYHVGDQWNSCRSLACHGGTPGKCSRYNPKGRGIKVTCMSGEKVKLKKEIEAQKEAIEGLKNTLEQERSAYKSMERELNATKKDFFEEHTKSLKDSEIHFDQLQEHYVKKERNLLKHELAFQARNRNNCPVNGLNRKPRNKCFKQANMCGKLAIARWETEFYPGGKFVPRLHKPMTIHLNRTLFNTASGDEEIENSGNHGMSVANYSVDEPFYKAPIVNLEKDEGRAIINYTMLEHVKGETDVDPVETMYRFNCMDKNDPTYNTYLCELMYQKNDVCDCVNEPKIKVQIPGHLIDLEGREMNAIAIGKFTCKVDQYFADVDIIVIGPVQQTSKKEDLSEEHTKSLKPVRRRRRLLQSNPAGC
jgi:hypothetical protein